MGGDIESAPEAPARAPVVRRGTAPHEERGPACASPAWARERVAGACPGAAAEDLLADPVRSIQATASITCR